MERHHATVDAGVRASDDARCPEQLCRHFKAFADIQPEAWHCLEGAGITHRSFGEGTVAGVKTLFGNTRFQADFRSLPSSDDTKTFSAERLAEQSFLRMRLTSAVPGFDEFCSQTLTEERLQEEATEKAESEAKQRQEKRAQKAAARTASAAAAQKARPPAQETAV